jgi:hypothetical protein
MSTARLVVALSVLSAVLLTLEPAVAQRPDPAVILPAQRAAMAPLAAMDGVWRGTAWNVEMDGTKHTVTHTERVGPFLDGTVKVFEGKGYDAEGKVAFNAFGTISYNPSTQKYTLRSYAMGNSGDFPVTVTPDGFVWEIAAGPMTIRYTAVIKDGTWFEYGERSMPGKEPTRFFEMTLKRIGDTDWPAGGAVPMR